MYWSDDDETPVEPKSSVQEVVFVLQGKTLPNNALPAIAQSLSEQVNDWESFADVGLHLKLGGEEGNGWFRESNPDAVLYLSRRTKLILRAGPASLNAIQDLKDFFLDVDGHSVKLVHKHNKALLNSSTLYSHHVISDFEEELEFLAYAQQQLQDLDIKCKKLLCGKSREMVLAKKIVKTRSLMLNDLSKEDSLLLQAIGFGTEQKRGCGVFIPYKSISK